MCKLAAAYFAVAVSLFVAVPVQAQRANDATALAERTSELYRRGRYAEALLLAQRALAISEKTRGPDHIDLARDYNNLAMGYLYLGRYAEAEPLMRRAAVILAKAGQGNAVTAAMVLDNLALINIKLGRYGDAEPLLQRAIQIFGKIRWPEHPDVSNALERLALLYTDLGRYSEAEPILLRVLLVSEKAVGSNHSEVARALGNLALLYRKMSRHSEAEPLYKRALAIKEKAFGLNHSEVATALSNFATLYLDRGVRLDEAEALYKRALSIQEKVFGPNHPDVAETLDAMAQLHKAQGRDADAAPLSRRAVAIFESAFGADHPSVARALTTLASFKTEVSAQQAESLYKRVLTINAKTFGNDHQSVATALDGLARSYRDQGRYAEAEPVLQRALSIYEKELGRDHIRVAAATFNLAEVYARQARFADALPLVQRFDGFNQRFVARPDLALPVLNGARQRNLLAADIALDSSLSVAQRYAHTTAARAIGSLAVRLAAGNDRLAQLVRKDQDLTAEAEKLDRDIIAAASNEPSKRNAAGEQRIRDRLSAIANERTNLLQILARDFADFSALSNPLPLTTKEIQSLLSTDEVMVIFAPPGDKEGYVFAITADAFDWHPIPLGNEALTQKVAAFRKGLDLDLDEALASGRKSDLFDLALAHELYGTLFGSVEPLVKDKKYVLVVPSGALTALPFHLLVTDKPSVAKPDELAHYRDAAWMLKRHAVTVLPSVGSLKALRVLAGKTQAARPMIGFADPVFNPDAPTASVRGAAKGRARNVSQAAFTDFWKGAGVDRVQIAQALPQLPDTADELRVVGQKLGASPGDLAFGRNATETAVKTAALSNYRIVYFATHGLVAGDIKDLAEPSLALSIPKQPTDLDDGLLTASEIAQLKLNADWVVLSACNTIAGDKPGAEALSGLARAFFYAGARALLVSHWAVDSAAATRLTTMTFDKLKSDPKIGRSEALRLSMLDYMNDKSNSKNAYPAYWAPFVVLGEGAPH